MIFRLENNPLNLLSREHRYDPDACQKMKSCTKQLLILCLIVDISERMFGKCLTFLAALVFRALVTLALDIFRVVDQRVTVRTVVRVAVDSLRVVR